MGIARHPAHRLNLYDRANSSSTGCKLPGVVKWNIANSPANMHRIGSTRFERYNWNHGIAIEGAAILWIWVERN